MGEEMSFVVYMIALVKELQKKGSLSTDVVQNIVDETDAAERQVVA
jgi:hypothetical protein